MNRVTLFEHDRLPKDYRGDLEPALPALFRFLKRIKCENAFAISGDSKFICSSSYVGVIKLKNITFEILPKIGKRPGEYKSFLEVEKKEKKEKRRIREESTKNLLYMLKFTKNIDIKETEIGPLLKKDLDWFEVLIYLYSSNLSKLLFQGIPRQYQTREENKPFLKGRWLIPEHLRKNLFHQERFYVRYYEMTIDTALHRILRFVSERLRCLTNSALNRTCLDNILAIYEDIEERPNIDEELKKVRFTRLNESYKPVFNLAKYFLENSSLQLIGGKDDVFAFIFDMNVLFEEFVFRFLQKYWNYIRPDVSATILSQKITGNLAIREDNEGRIKSVFGLKPDILFKGDKKSMILDTKYKLLKKDRQNTTLGLDSSDVYQLYVYCQRLKSDEISRAIMLFPKQEDSDIKPVIYKFAEKENGKYEGTLLVATVDLLKDLRSERQSLIDELKNIIEIGWKGEKIHSKKEIANSNINNEVA